MVESWRTASVVLAIALSLVIALLYGANSVVESRIGSLDKKAENAAAWRGEMLAYIFNLRDLMKEAGLDPPPIPKTLTDPTGETANDEQGDNEEDHL